MRSFLLCLVIGVACGCGQPSSQPEPYVSATMIDVSAVRGSASPTSIPDDIEPDQVDPDKLDGPLVPAGEAPNSTSRPIAWPEGPLKLDSNDVLEFTKSQGGVAGTDFTTLRICGDGTVKLTSGRAGGPGGRSSESAGKMDAKTTSQLFEEIRSSGLLDSTDEHTRQSHYSVDGTVDEVKISVGVSPGSARHSSIEALIEPARKSLKP
jgi:hypothetical protein